jgi:hypothetical protein
LIGKIGGIDVIVLYDRRRSGRTKRLCEFALKNNLDIISNHPLNIKQFIKKYFDVDYENVFTPEGYLKNKRGENRDLAIDDADLIEEKCYTELLENFNVEYVTKLF